MTTDQAASWRDIDPDGREMDPIALAIGVGVGVIAACREFRG